MTDILPKRDKGYAVVLTADRTSMAGYGALFGGMLSASQTTMVPGFIMKHMVAPCVESDGVRVRQAPLGLRRVEAALRNDGWDRNEVAVVRPEDLEDAVGPDTRIIALASGDPLGIGMNSTTMAGVLGGEIYTSRWFRDLAERVAELRRRWPGICTVMGGPGAWQLKGRPEAREKLGVDHVVTGNCESNVAQLFRDIADRGSVGAVLTGRDGMVETIPRLQGATTMGAVEISRGCGLGCRFCTLRRVPMRHVPEETILADVETNVVAGISTVSLITEDVFRYGAEGATVQPEVLIGLMNRMRSSLDVGLVQTDHANVGSVRQYSDGELREVRDLMAGETDGQIWLNLGVETASGELLASNGGLPKMVGCPPKDWGEMCMEQVRRLVQAGFLPLVSLVMGLPGERDEDVRATFEWVKRLEGEKVAVFPMFYAPANDEDNMFTVNDMTDEHWRLFKQSYRLNFRWMPMLCWDNQSHSGVPLWRRLAIRAMSSAGTAWWKCVFAWRSGRLTV